jgi:predicted PurR-regulated permease PerM
MVSSRTVRPKKTRNPETSPEILGTPPSPVAHRWALHEISVFILAILFMCGLAFSVQTVLSPFVLVAAIAFLLYPYRQNEFARRVIQLAVAFLALWILYSLSGILAPFVIAYLLAYILNPLVSMLERKRIPRWGSSLILVVTLIALVVTLLLFGMPLLVSQFQGLTGSLGKLVADLRDLLSSGRLFVALQEYGIPIEKVQETIRTQLTPRIEQILTTLFEGVFGVVSSVSSVALQVINAVIIPFLLFYLLKDFPASSERFFRFFPAQNRDRVRKIMGRVDDIMGRYFRGAIVVAIIQGTLSATVLLLLGVQYALMLGVMTAILNFIPYLGLVTSLVVASVVALFSGEPVVTKVVGVIVLYLSQKLLEASVLGPKIIGAQVGLHPVVLIMCLMVFGYFLGFVGLLIAVPMTALILAMYDEWEARREGIV